MEKYNSLPSTCDTQKYRTCLHSILAMIVRSLAKSIQMSNLKTVCVYMVRYLALKYSSMRMAMLVKPLVKPLARN